MLESGGTHRSSVRPGQQMTRRSSQEQHRPLELMKGWGGNGRGKQQLKSQRPEQGVEGRKLLFAHF